MYLSAILTFFSFVSLQEICETSEQHYNQHGWNSQTDKHSHQNTQNRQGYEQHSTGKGKRNAQPIKSKYPADQHAHEAKRKENIYAEEYIHEPLYQAHDDIHKGQAAAPIITPYEDAGALLMPIRRVEDTEVLCHKNYMTVKFKFSTGFNGYIYPYQQFPHCILFSGHQSHNTEITLYHGACGKKFIKDENDPEFSPIIEHRLMIQWEKMFICEDDSSVIVRCDRPDDFNKTIEWKFQAEEFDTLLERNTHPGPQMWMEIQYGEGPGATPVEDINKPIHIGDTLTLVFALSDDVFWFDSNILSCTAVDGGGEIQKIEWQNEESAKTALGYTGRMTVIEDACSLKPKLFSHFHKDKVTKDGHLIILQYAHFKAFRFPTSLKIVLQCDVEVCYKQCSTLPSCSLGFQPRSAAKERRRREIRDQDAAPIDTAQFYKTLEIHSPEDGSLYKEVPILTPTGRSIALKDCPYCYSSTTFYLWVGVLSFVICALIALMFFLNNSNSSRAFTTKS